jgi:hypothetical protein
MRRRDFVIASLMSSPLASHRGFAAQSPVVLELFTSQGCSSCPPADAFLGKLAREAGVIGLAWHVDYWNSLGWHDRFSRPEWTERQKAYAKSLNEEVYTPALVVNGAAMVVGSDKAAIRRAIASATPPSVTVALRRDRRDETRLRADVGTAAAATTAQLIIYDPEQSTQVDAGENQGHQLTEFRVVRSAITLDSGLTLPPVPENRGAVLLVRDAFGRIIGAANSPPALAG